MRVGGSRVPSSVAEPSVLPMTAAAVRSPVVWTESHSSSRPRVVDGIADLRSLVGALGRDQFATISTVRAGGRRVAQMSAVDGEVNAWVVEVLDDAVDGVMKLVYFGAPGSYRRAPDGPRQMTLGIDAHSPGAAADLVWSWMRGTLPTGAARSVRHLPVRFARRRDLQDE